MDFGIFGIQILEHFILGGLSYSTLLSSVALGKNVKGHLCLWREDSLKEKYKTKYFKIIFYLIFRVYK